MGRSGRSPAAKKYIQADTQVDQRDQAQALLYGIISRLRIDRCDLNIHALAVHQIGGRKVNATAIEQLVKLHAVGDGSILRKAVDSQQTVANLDSVSIAWTVRHEP